APRRSRLLARDGRHRDLPRADRGGQADPRRRDGPAPRPALKVAGGRLHRGVPALGVPRRGDGDRVVPGGQPAPRAGVPRPRRAPPQPRGGRGPRGGGLRLRQRGLLQRLARGVVHRGVPARGAHRHSHRAARLCPPRDAERVAALLPDRGSPAPAVPGPRGVPLPHHGVRRPRQRVDAHRRPHRVPGGGHPRVLAGDPERAVRRGGGVVAVAGPPPADRPRRPLPLVRPGRGGAGVTARGGRRRHAVLLAVAVLYSVFPIYFVTVQSLKTPQEDVFGSPLYVTHPTFENYTELFEEGAGRVRGFVVIPRVPFVLWLVNSAVVLGLSLAVTLVAGVLAAYALGRLRPPGWRWWRRILF